MASYFVKKAADGGSDANNGTTWALAKATIQAGFNLCTVAGDFLYVAPGRYFESNINPPSAGTRANKKSFVGDWNSTIQDGGGNKSGVEQGYVIIDSTKQTSNFGFVATAGPFLIGSANHAYWNFKNLVCTGSAYGFILWGTGAGVATDGTTFENIIGDAWAEKGLQHGNFAVDPDAGATITFKNCIGISRAHYLNWLGGMYLDCFKSTTSPTNPTFTIERCFLNGCTHGFTFNSSVTQRLKVKFSNCSIVAGNQGYSNTPIIYGAGSDATYGPIDFYDSYLQGYRTHLTSGTGLSTPTFTRCKFYCSDQEPTQTSEVQPCLWSGIDYLYPGSPAVDTNSSNGVFPDIFGNATYGNADFGCQELYPGVHLREPMAQLPLSRVRRRAVP